ncbi:MAG: BatD family protein [Woeseiaceae bacterium]|nr:BatD family protein [Woeseiaceae bacterium]
MRERLAVLLMLIVATANATAGVTAKVDRPAVDLNESFTLELVVDGNADVEPQISVLDDAFFVGQSSQLSNTTIVNGQISRSRTWTYTLMAKQSGEITIPPIPVGADRSNPVTIRVREPSKAPPGEAEVFVTSEVDFDETYVQAQILYTIKIYRAVATRQPSLREPQISGAEVLVELAGDERNYDAVLNGKAYNVVERVIAIYPQESGEIQISPARFEARVLRDGRITGRKVFNSGSHTIDILPQPAPPDDYPNAAWLPARDVQISEEWSREPRTMKAGEPLTRRVRLSALGQLETQLPAIEPPPVDGINMYPDRPELSRAVEAGGIRGIREDQYAMIGVGAGPVEIPPLELPWWDIEAGEWRVARLPAHAIEVIAARMSSAPQPEPVPEANEVTTPQETVDPGADGELWRRIAELLAALWVVTLLAWWWSSRPRKERSAEPRELPVHKQQAKHLKRARKAALETDAAELKAALLDWARLQWPDDTPRSLGALSVRVSEPLAGELRLVSAASYGPSGQGWDSQSLASALRSFSVLSGEYETDRNTLPPLMPGVS